MNKLITNNPYRIVGLLVGATAREQTRQIQRLNQFIEAEQEPDDDFSFPTLGKIIRTIESVTDSASKLNLDSDKMNASLFWFYNGNPITDEPAFDALKDDDINQAINIWSKLTSTSEVTQRNASAHSNLGTLYLCQNTNEDILEKGISLKLKFLESDFIKDFKALATDETYKTTKKELQLIFLNQIQTEIEKNGGITSNKFLEILSKQTFLAKDDFLKGFVQKPIEQIELKINEARSKRKANKGNSEIIGIELVNQTNDNLILLKSVLGVSNLKYSSIADKLANEILQSSIDYFNHHKEQDSDIDYFKPAIELATKANNLAIGQLAKDRIKDSLETLAEMKDRELGQAIQVLQSIKDAYEEASKQIDKQVDDMQYDTFGGIGGSAPMRMRKFDVSINWSKVEETKRNALNWNKVVELILEAIPNRNIEKIKKINNPTKINQFKELVNFVLGKINYSNSQKIRYLCYWETAKTGNSTTPLSTATNRQTTTNVEGIPDWIKWVGGIILFIILIKACN